MSWKHWDADEEPNARTFVFSVQRGFHAKLEWLNADEFEVHSGHLKLGTVAVPQFANVEVRITVARAPREEPTR